MKAKQVVFVGLGLLMLIWLPVSIAVWAFGFGNAGVVASGIAAGVVGLILVDPTPKPTGPGDTRLVGLDKDLFSSDEIETLRTLAERERRTSRGQA